jgi:single-stranded DNA-binding protein
MLEGRLTFDSWTGKDGAKRSKLRVTVESFQFLPAGGSGSGGEQGGAAGGESQIPSEDNGLANEAQAGSKDDIPF